MSLLKSGACKRSGIGKRVEMRRPTAHTLLELMHERPQRQRKEAAKDCRVVDREVARALKKLLVEQRSDSDRLHAKSYCQSDNPRAFCQALQNQAVRSYRELSVA